MTAIFKREYRSYFRSPIGFVFLALIILLEGLAFNNLLYDSSTQNIHYLYSNIFQLGVFLIPILTMKSLSDDKKNKTDQALLTAPVSITRLVFGKFLGAFALYATAVGATLLHILILCFTGQPNLMLILGNLIGILLFGVALIAIGVFISSLTESQVISAIATYGTAFFLMYIDTIVGDSAVLSGIAGWMSFSQRYAPFLSGILSFSGIIYFTSVTAVFIFLTVRNLESRRWR